MTTNLRNIYQRLNQVMIEAESIQKPCTDSINALHESMLKALHMRMIRAGIAMIPDICELSQNGLRAVVKVTISFVKIDNPQDRIQVNSMGYGMDPFDSGVGKAMSSAVKYAQQKFPASKHIEPSYDGDDNLYMIDIFDTDWFYDVQIRETNGGN